MTVQYTARKILASLACLSPLSHADSNTGASSFLGPWYGSPICKKSTHHLSITPNCPVTGIIKHNLSTILCIPYIKKKKNITEKLLYHIIKPT